MMCMSSLYLSTGRKPSQLTRKLSRLLCLILQAKYENRGKRSVEEICSRAEKFGCRRIAFIYEKKGNPSSIEFFDEEAGWLSEIIAISGIHLPERKGGKRIPPTIELVARDAAGEKMLYLLGIQNKADDEISTLRGAFSSSGMEFFLRDEKILHIKGKTVILKGKNANKKA